MSQMETLREREREWINRGKRVQNRGEGREKTQCWGGRKRGLAIQSVQDKQMQVIISVRKLDVGPNTTDCGLSNYIKSCWGQYSITM